MSRSTRRQFLQHAAAAGAAFPLFTVGGTKASGQVVGANDRVRIGVCGFGGRGATHIRDYLKLPNVEVSHLIDIDTRNFGKGIRMVEEAGGKSPTCVQDLREVLDDDSLDAISIATCNHTHSLLTIWACQAGKDVYVEKPISHNVWEGRKCVEAAARYKRIVQHGTQARSSQGWANDIAALQSGGYGKLLVAKAYASKPRPSIGIKEPKPAPDHIDFNLWLGPAELQPYHENIVHYNWHWFWDFGNGEIGNQGVHQMDIARWGIPGATLPNRVWSLGGRFGYQDQGETPNTILSVFEFDEALLVFETRGLVGKDTKLPSQVTNEFYTTEGRIANGKFYPKSGDKAERLKGGNPKQLTPDGPFGSFVAAVRSRDLGQVNAPVEDAHYSSALCHLGNISYRLGKDESFSTIDTRASVSPQVADSIEAIKSTLDAAGVKLDGAIYRQGADLKFNPKEERFVDNPAADALLTRQYRAPFVVPESV
jgi:predicted dehydrogenase